MEFDLAPHRHRVWSVSWRRQDAAARPTRLAGVSVSCNHNRMLGDHCMLGVLGGMGPLASAHFMLRLTQLTSATRDQDHIPTVLWSDPRVPDRTLGRLGDGADPLPWLLRGIRGLRAAGCKAIAI